MIHPTRTNLLILKDKARSVVNSIGILKARKQALVREFLATTLPFLRSREDIRAAYGAALRELALALGREGRDAVESAAAATERDFSIEVREKSIWGLRYKDIAVHDAAVRESSGRGYDEYAATAHLEEATQRFEKMLDALLAIAEYESKLKRLGSEIMRTTRRIKVLEEMVYPTLRRQIRAIAQYIGEREREAFYRLKRVKEALTATEAGRRRSVLQENQHDPIQWRESPGHGNG